MLTLAGSDHDQIGPIQPPKTLGSYPDQCDQVDQVCVCTGKHVLLQLTFHCKLLAALGTQAPSQ